MDFWFNIAVSVVLGLADSIIKNEVSRDKYRRVMTKIRDVLNVAFPATDFPQGTSRLTDAAFAKEVAAQKKVIAAI